MSSNSFDMALKKVYMDLLVKHMNRARAEDEEARTRLFRLIEDFEWVYPDKEFYV